MIICSFDGLNKGVRNLETDLILINMAQYITTSYRNKFAAPLSVSKGALCRMREVIRVTM